MKCIKISRQKFFLPVSSGLCIRTKFFWPEMQHYFKTQGYCIQNLCNNGAEERHTREAPSGADDRLHWDNESFSGALMPAYPPETRSRWGYYRWHTVAKLLKEDSFFTNLLSVLFEVVQFYKVEFHNWTFFYMCINYVGDGCV